MAKMMRALIKKKPIKGYELVTLPIPTPEDDEVLIRVEYNSICGSDVNLYLWNDVAKQIAKIPFIPGHECVGTVVKKGPNAKGSIKIGQRVCVENHFFCGECFQCNNEQAHICADMGQFGHGKKTSVGGLAEYANVRERYLYAVRSNIDSKIACLLEPFGVAHHAVEEVELRGETLLVTGCGPIGLCVIAIAKLLGSSKIIASDIFDDKLALAKRMGADIVINSKSANLREAVLAETNNVGAGCLIEASGAPSVVNNAFTMLRKGGRVLFLGIPKQPMVFNDPIPNVILKSITLKTIHGRKIFHTWSQAEDLLEKIDISPIISHVLPLTSFAEAHERIIQGTACKVIIDLQRPPIAKQNQKQRRTADRSVASL